MTDHRVGRTDLHVRIGIGDAVIVKDQGIALDVALATVGVILDTNQTSITGPTAVLGDRLGHDLGRGLRSGVGHLGTSVLMLTRSCIGHRQHLARCLRADEHHSGILHGQAGTDVAVDPLHVPLGLYPGPLGNKVVYVGRPVLNGGVGDPGSRLDHDLHHRRVQRIGAVHRCRTALDVVHLGTLVGNDQGALKLTHVLGIDAEVGLQRHFDLDAGRHVDE